MATGLSRKKALIVSGATDSNDEQPKPRAKQTFNMDVFRAGTLGLLKGYKLAPENDETNSSKVLEQFISELQDSFGIPVEQQYGNAVDAINGAEAWLIKTNWYYSEPVLYDINGVTVTLTMPANSGQISVAMSVTPREDVELDIVIADMKLKLQQAITSAFPRKSSNQDEHNSAKPKEEHKPKTESFNVSAIVVGEYQGKRTIRVIPTNGRWQEHGVAIYDDKIEELGLEIPEEEGEYEFKGRMTYEMKDNDKPSRVIRLTGDYV